MPYPKGKPISIKHREALRQGAKRKWLDPEYREKMRNIARSLWKNPEFRKKVIEANKKDERRKKISEHSKKIWQNEDYRAKVLTLQRFKKQSETMKKNMTPERLEMYRQNGRKHKHHTEEAKRKISEASKKHWQNPEYRKKVLEKSIGNKEVCSKAGKASWKDKEKQLKAILKGFLKRPTKYEQKIIDLCKKYNLPFKYVGNGKVIINYANPDFIEVNGKKLLIEVYNSFFHPKDYEENRAKRFAKYGYRTLFLNENDIESENWEEVCLNKIREFMEKGDEICLENGI